MANRKLIPEPDCRLCGGGGWFKVVHNPHREAMYECECTMICPCGEERPSNLMTCVGCSTQGCDACGEIEWCCDENDEANGDYFCSECRAPAPESEE